MALDHITAQIEWTENYEKKADDYKNKTTEKVILSQV
jgi:hypothetical protein